MLFKRKSPDPNLAALNLASAEILRLAVALDEAKLQIRRQKEHITSLQDREIIRSLDEFLVDIRRKDS